MALSFEAKVHKVQGVGASLLLGKAVQQVLRAGTWKSESTFCSFYLRNVIHRSMDTSIGSFGVAASCYFLEVLDGVRGLGLSLYVVPLPLLFPLLLLGPKAGKPAMLAPGKLT